MTATIEYTDTDELLRKAVAIVESLGCTVIQELHWQTPAEVALAFGLTPSNLTMKLQRYNQPFPSQRGPSGRILRLHVTERLAAYLKGL